MTPELTLEEIYRLNKGNPNGVFKFRADRVPFFYAMTLFALQLGAFFTLSAGQAAVFGLLSLPFLGSVAIYNHHQQHHGAFNNAALNRFFELIMGIQTMIPAYAWVLHHNYGHHPNYMNQRPEDNVDESRWTRHDGSQMGRIEYTVRLMMTGPIDSHKVGFKRRKALRNFYLMMIPYVAVQLPMLLYNWMNFFLIIVIPAFLMAAYVCWLTYEHHSGLYTKNELEASRNRLGRFYNFRSFNLGYHTAHHMKPYLHWSLLPHYHKLIEKDIPEHCFVPCW